MDEKDITRNSDNTGIIVFVTGEIVRKHDIIGEGLPNQRPRKGRDCSKRPTPRACKWVTTRPRANQIK